MYNIFAEITILINLHPFKHPYVNFFSESNFAPIVEYSIFNHSRYIYTENYFRIPYHLMSRKHVILIIY